MGRYKRLFTLYARKTKDRKKMWYVRIYSADGSSRIAFSSGLTSKEAAFVKYTKLLSDPDEYSRIIDSYESRKSSRSKIVTGVKDFGSAAAVKPYVLFSDYAEKWWIWDECEYVRAKRNRGTERHPGIKRSTTDTALMWKNKYIVPFFGNYRLKEINPDLVDSFFNYLKEDRNMSPKTINNIRAILMTMFNQAVRRGLVERNPVAYTDKFRVERKKTDLLTLEEMREIFSWDNFERCWNSDYLHYAVCLLAAFTGMRQGEIRGLKKENLFTDHVHVSFSYGKYGDGTTKNSEERDIPIPYGIYKLVMYQSALHPESEYIFTANGRSPLCDTSCRRSLYRAMEAIGITKQEREDRNLTFHSMRHFFTTYCVSENINQTKIRTVTGHKTLNMLDRYTDLGLMDLSEINRAMESLTNFIFIK